MNKPATASESQERIRAVAAELFARDGYHATGVAALCDAVQLGRGALYYYIGDKEALLYEICRYGIDQLVPEATVIVTSDDETTVKFRRLARCLMVNIASNRAAWTVFFREFYALTGARRSEIEKGRAMYEQLWNQVLAEGVETAIFDPRLVNPLVAKGILGMFNYSYLWYDVHGSLTPEQIADQFTDVLLHGILPEQAQHPVPSGAGAGAQRIAHVD